MTKTKVVSVVNAIPTADFTLNLFGTELATHNFSTDATNYIWDMGDSNIFYGNNPSHSYATPGYFTVTLTAFNGCDSASHSQDIIVLPDQITARPDFYMEKQGGCPEETLYFFDSSTENAESWYWVFDGGSPSISEDKNPVITYSTPGTYDVLLVVGNDAGTDSRYRANFVVVQEAPTASFTFSQDDNLILFNNTSEEGLFYEWSFGDGTSSVEINPGHTYDYGGDFEVELKTINYCDTSVTTQMVTYFGPPLADGSYSQTNPCDLFVNYTNLSQGQIDSLKWNFEGGTPTNSIEENPIVVYSDEGSYATTLIVYNANGSDTLMFNTEVTNPISPVSDFTWQSNNAEYSFINNSTNGVSYLWDFGDGNTSPETNPMHTYAGSGAYTVTLISQNACDSDTLTKIVDFVSSLNGALTTEKLSIYPNPTQKDFVLLGQGFSDHSIKLQMFNGLGKLVHEEIIPIRNGNFSFNVHPGNLADGTYYLSFNSSLQSFSRKLVILN